MQEEFLHTRDLGDCYQVPADNRDLNYIEYFEEDKVSQSLLSEFTSANTTT